MVAFLPNLQELGAASNPATAMTPNESRFRTTLIRVLIVQAVTLVLLGLLQLVYNV